MRHSVFALLVTMLLTMLAVPRPVAADGPPTFELAFVARGYDICCDTQGNVYVADADRQTIRKFSGTDGQLLGELVSAPSGPAAFGRAGSCTVDNAGNIYVGDERGAVDVFDSGFHFVRSWPAIRGILRLSPDQSRLYSFLGFATGGLKAYDVATGAHLWDRGVNAYRFDVGPSGILYFDHGSYVSKFSSSGDLLSLWGTFGIGDGQFTNGGPVACDASENVYVCDASSGRVQKLTSDGAFLTKWGTSGSGIGQFLEFDGIAVDPQGSVFVLDSYLNRVQKFSYGTTPTKRSTWSGLKRRYR